MQDERWRARPRERRDGGGACATTVRASVRVERLARGDLLDECRGVHEAHSVFISVPSLGVPVIAFGKNLDFRILARAARAEGLLSI